MNIWIISFRIFSAKRKQENNKKDDVKIPKEEILAVSETDAFFRNSKETSENDEKIHLKDDKNDKIFTLWLQGEDKAPPLVQACFRSVRKNCKQELVVLDEKTVFDYITLPDVIMEKRKKGKIGHAHFADICRVELLYNHGGYWLDSTGFATSPIQKWISDEDFFVYLTGLKVGSPYSFMQNCFIRARKGAYLLDAWRAMILEYWKYENSNFDYFMHQLLFKTLVMNDERAKKHFHSTAAQAANTAKQAEAGTLILGHFSARYNNENILLEEAKEIFKNSYLAKENATFTIE